MKLSQFSNKLLNQWPYKLACLGLAIVVYMLHRSLELEKKTFTIPVQIVQNGAVVSTDSKIGNVTLTIRTDAETISTIHNNDFNASINLNNLSKSGEYQIPIDVDIKSELYDIHTLEIKQKPQTIKIHVEKKDVGYIPLEPVFVGDASYGYEISETIIEPKFIEVIGPESIIKNTTSIKTEKIDINEKSSTFTSNVGSKNTNSLLQIIDKGPYSVKVIMDSIKIERILENNPIDFKNLSSEFVLVGQYPEVSVTLYGPLKTLETFEIAANAVWVDLSSISEEGTYEIPVQVNVPSVFKLNGQSVDVINITVEKAKEVAVNESDEKSEDNHNEASGDKKAN